MRVHAYRSLVLSVGVGLVAPFGATRLGLSGVGTSSFARMLALLVGVYFMVWSVVNYWYYVRTPTPTARHSS